MNAVTDDPITDLENGFADLIRQGRIRTRRQAFAIDPRLDPANYPLIVMLGRHDSVPMSQLVAALGLDKSTVTRQIDAVVRLGLAQRRPDPADARARVISLTDAGRTRVAEVSAAANADWRQRLATWEPDDIRTLTTLLKRLVDEPQNTGPNGRN